MRTLVVLAFAWCCSAQFVVPYSNLVSYNTVPSYPWTFKYSVTDAFGETAFSHQAINHNRHKARLAVTYFDSAAPEVKESANDALSVKKLSKEQTVAEEPAAEDPTTEEPVAEEKNSRQKRQLKFTLPSSIGQTIFAWAGNDRKDDKGHFETVDQRLHYTFSLPHIAPYLLSGIPLRVKSGRHRRDVAVPLPYLHAVPTEAEATVETKQFEIVDAATPADTTKIELTTKKHVFKVPSIKYVRPVVNVKQYTAAVSPAGALPYYGSFPYHPFGFSGLRYPTLLTPAVKEE